MGDADKVGKEFIQVQLRLGRREEAAAPKIRDCCMQDDEVNSNYSHNQSEFTSSSSREQT